MVSRTVLALVFSLGFLPAAICLAQESHPAGDSADLRAIIDDIGRQMLTPSTDYREVIAALQADVDKLTAALEAGTLGETEAQGARWNRSDPVDAREKDGRAGRSSCRRGYGQGHRQRRGRAAVGRNQQ